MREVNVTELRNHLPKYLSSVRRGSDILITSHGRVIARLTSPIDVRHEARKQLEKLQKHCKIKDVVSPLDEDWEASH